MKQSASLLFPFTADNENNCLKRTNTVEYMLLSAIRIFLLTRKGSRVGNYVGSFLPELFYQNIPTSSLSSLAESLKEELINNFPGVDFLIVSLTRDESPETLNLKISFSSGLQENITDLIMNIPSVFDSSQNFQTSL